MLAEHLEMPIRDRLINAIMLVQSLEQIKLEELPVGQCIPITAGMQVILQVRIM